MSEYQDVVQFHKNDKTGKWRVQRLGYARKNDKGQLNLYLDALPLPGIPVVVTDRQEQGSAPDRGALAGDMGDMNDEIPFGPEWR